jgi:hypothetical protein
MYRNLQIFQLKNRGIKNVLFSMQKIKGKRSWFTNGNILLNNISTFIHTESLVTKLDIISVSNPAYTITIFIIPPSLKNTGQSCKRHPNTHA